MELKKFLERYSIKDYTSLLNENERMNFKIMQKHHNDIVQEFNSICQNTSDINENSISWIHENRLHLMNEEKIHYINDRFFNGNLYLYDYHGYLCIDANNLLKTGLFCDDGIRIKTLVISSTFLFVMAAIMLVCNYFSVEICCISTFVMACMNLKMVSIFNSISIDFPWKENLKYIQEYIDDDMKGKKYIVDHINHNVVSTDILFLKESDIERTSV